MLCIKTGNKLGKRFLSNRQYFNNDFTTVNKNLASKININKIR